MNTTSELLTAADRCVKCALCLPHCPTYQLHANENESPRGRIALAEGLLSGQLPMDAAVQRHLDHCVMCQRCETVCPSQVEYGRIMQGVREHWPTKRHWSHSLLLRPKFMRALVRIAQSLPHWQSWPLGIRLAQALGTQTKVPAPGIYLPLRGKSRGRVGLLLGCATQALQASALDAALRLLQTLGYTVVIPSQQGCCGALATHQGDSATATQGTILHQAQFADVDTIVSIASGCVAGSPLALVDILAFVAQDPEVATLPWRAWSAPVAVQLPCTVQNALVAGQQLIRLLQQIPDLDMQLLEGGCCGAAGDHLLRHRAQACALRQPLLDQIQAGQVQYLLSSNIGCALHLAEGLNQIKQPIQVWHPVELLVHCLPG